MGSRSRLGGPKQRALLAMLLLHRGEVVSTDRLIDRAVGRAAAGDRRKTVQGYVSHLRKALGDEVLVTRGRGYLLAVEREQVDVERFEALVADGRRALAVGDAAGARSVWARRWGCGAASRWLISRTSRSRRREIARLGRGAAGRARGSDRRRPGARRARERGRGARGARARASAARAAAGAADARAVPVRAPDRRA